MDGRLKEKIVYDIIDDVICVLSKHGIYPPSHYKNSDINDKNLKNHRILYKNLTNNIISLLNSQNDIYNKTT